MSIGPRLADWLDIREGEAPAVGLAFAGAFLVMAFLVLARSLREGLYLEQFDASTIPYITAAAVILGLPVAAAFSRALTRIDPLSAIRRLALGLGAGIIVLAVVVRLEAPLASQAGVVAFYLWTALGTLLLASGFWLVVAELFALREAKRLFGIVSAGGTVGYWLAGIGLAPLTSRLGAENVMPLLVVILLAGLALDRLVPTRALRPVEPSDGSAGGARPLGVLWRDRHLRLIALIVFTVGVVSFLVDYQFKEWAQVTFEKSGDRLTPFFGAVYGWTGALALGVQLLLTGRIIAAGGVAWSLAVLPLALVLGSVGMLLAPGIVFATLLRGTDTTLRKSLFRSVAEFLWVPVPASLRRRTKAFIDSNVDSFGEGLGALIVFLWVTLSGYSSRYLSVFALLFLGALLLLARRMGDQYFATLRSRLRQSGDAAAGLLADSGLDQRDLLNATLTRLDISRVFTSGDLGLEAPRSGLSESPASPPTRGEREPAAGAGEESSLADVLDSGDVGRISGALVMPQDWTEDHVPPLARLLARDRLVEAVAGVLTAIGPEAVGPLAELLADETGDFVIRRRIPQALVDIDDPAADEALVRALAAGRFEIRYRAGLALQRRRGRGRAEWTGDWRAAVWKAVRAEVGRERPVWELARLLDGDPDDRFVERRVGLRGELSLEHSFRLFSLVLDPEAIRTAYHGIVLGDPELRSFSLEYLEQVLPPDVRTRLWPFIGDLSESRQRRAIRGLDAVVSDLLQTGATLFASEEGRRALLRVLDEEDGEDAG